MKVAHSMIGRVRIVDKQLLRNDELVALVNNAIRALDGVTSTRTNAKCGSVVISFFPDTVSEKTVLTLIAKELGVEEPSAKGGCGPNCKCASPCGRFCKCAVSKKAGSGESTPAKCDCKTGEHDGLTIKGAATRFGLISAVMGGVLVRTSLLGLTVAETIFSPLGIIAVVASIPLVRKGFRQAKDKHFTLEVFLGASCIAAVLGGEAMTAFEVLWINSGAELVKAWISERSRKSIAQILDDTTHHTFVLVDGMEVEAEISELNTGDVVVLHTGEKICVDGEIVDGKALVDESPISGRPDFVPRESGDTVYAGSFVREGVIYVRASAVGDSTYLARIMCMVEDSLQNKAPIESVADKLASTLVKVGFVTTGATYLLTGSFMRAFTVMLVMACPCATVLAASTAISGAISAAAKRNILIKGGRYLEELAATEVVCFDKTGTLTTTEPILANVLPMDGYTERELMEIACTVEQHNHHPLAQAMKMAALERGIEPVGHSVCEYYLGMGMRAEIGNDSVLIGNKKLMEKYRIKVGGVSSKISPMRRKGLTVLYIAKNKEIIGIFAFDNLTRPESGAVVANLLNNGLQDAVLITGDEHNTAQNLAEKLNINTYHASILPEDKAKIVSAMQENGKSVLMVGDGINDALALAKSDVGVAMGAGGSEVAIEAADIALVNDDLNGLVYVHSLSQQTLKIVHQNFWIATGSNLLGVGLAFTGLLSPVMAGALHIVHSLGVLGNSSRLLGFDGVPELEQSTNNKELNT
ncbi:MAG: heavy metal translocating P-type ATPase [Desulfovibrio sp.]